MDESLKDLPILVAGNTDIEKLTAIAEDTKTFICSVGPFVQYCSTIVATCAYTGTNYCDVSGEDGWIRLMIDKYDDVAIKTGSKIIHFCGAACVPAELTTFMAAEKIKERGDTIKKIELFNEIEGGFAGGSVNTLLSEMKYMSVYNTFKFKTGFDPMLKLHDSKEKPTTKVLPNYRKIMGYSNTHKSWVANWFISYIDSIVLGRSNAMLKWSQNLEVEEQQVTSGFAQSFVQTFSFPIFMSLLIPPFVWPMRKYVLP